MGCYGGDGARKVATVQPSGDAAAEPARLPDRRGDRAGRLRQLGRVGVLGGARRRRLGHLLRAARARGRDAGGASHIIFIVRDDDGHSDLLFQTSDTTWQAYNHYGGNSLYTGVRRPAAPTRSATTGRSPRAARAPEDWVFNAEYPMVRWLEPNGYDVSYFTGVDTDRCGAELLEHKAFLSVGHDEYWSAGQRATSRRRAPPASTWRSSAATRCSGRRAGSRASTAPDTPYRTLVTYKETHARRQDRPAPGRVDGHLARLRASARRPTAAGPRTR